MIEYASNRVPLKRLSETGGVLAVITEIVGTSYRNLGTMMAFGPDGQRTGSLSSGCIEDDIAEHAAEVFVTGKAKSLRYGQGSPFFDLKLPCGGGLSILLIPQPDPATLRAVLARGDARQQAVLRIGLTDGALTLLADADAAAPGDFVVVLEPELRFWVYGHGIEAISFALMAQAAGYDVTLFGQEGLQADLSRVGPLNITRVPSFRSYTCPVPDRRTAITLFFHDHENEARLLAQFLPSDAFFIGAQGSLKARQRLLADLEVQGVSAAHIANLRTTFGLIGSCRDPRTLAVSVLAHVLSVAGDSASAYAMVEHNKVREVPAA
ncbi:XdhC family protein [bacterium]|nr:XdhC family protein [bacterium]